MGEMLYYKRAMEFIKIARQGAVEVLRDGADFNGFLLNDSVDTGEI
jgi:hypothetical protein